MGLNPTRASRLGKQLLRYLTCLPLALGVGYQALAQEAPATDPASLEPTEKAGQPSETPSPEQQALQLLPELSLDASTLYQIMLAEIAWQRGQAATAYANYLDLAQRLKDHRLARRAVEIALTEQNIERALFATQTWYQLAPDNPQASQSLIVLLLTTNKLDEAEPILQNRFEIEKKGRKPKEQGTDNPREALYDSVQRLVLRAPDRQKGYQLLQRLFRDDLTSVDAQLALATQAAAANRNADAIQHLRKAQSINDSPEVAVALSQFLLLRENKADAAIQELTTYLERHPEQDEVEEALGRLYASERKWQQARTIFERLHVAKPRDVSLLHTLGLIATQQNDRSSARQFFDSYVKLRDSRDGRDIIAIYLTLSQMAEDAKDWRDALQWLDKIPNNQTRLDTLIRYSSIYGRQRQFAKAETYLARANAKTDADRVQLTLARANLLKEQNRFEEALATVAAQLQTLPEETDLLYERAMIAEKLDKLDLLESSLRLVMSLRPDNPHAYNALGYSLTERNLRLDEAEKLIDKALELAPNDPYILDSKGWVQYRRGDAKAAEATLRKAYSIKDDPEIALHLGEALWSLNQREEAMRLWRSVMKREPENPQLRSILQRLQVSL